MKKIIIWKIIVVSTVLLLPSLASSQETYKFERMWPTLKQPWYFSHPEGIAIDSNGFVYVADTWNGRIQKFTTDGQFVAKWGSGGYSYGIAVESSGFVYVGGNYSIQKFTSDGQFVARWGSRGYRDGEFNGASSIAIDNNGFVYVCDTYNNRIQKFTSDGQFVDKWGSGRRCFLHGGEGCEDPDGDGPLELGDGQFNLPDHIAIDNNGFVYVADTCNGRIQKFTTDGQFVAKWGSAGRGDGEFVWPHSIAIDNNGFVYVTDSRIYIQKFTSEGDFVDKWEGRGNVPLGIATDNNGFVYLANSDNSIQKFTSEGDFVDKWESKGSGDGEFAWPSPSFLVIKAISRNQLKKHKKTKPCPMP